MYAIDNAIYTPALRGKKGEWDALHSLDNFTKDRILPHVVLPPVEVRDLEKGRVLSINEYPLSGN